MTWLILCLLAAPGVLSVQVEVTPNGEIQDPDEGKFSTGHLLTRIPIAHSLARSGEVCGVVVATAARHGRRL